MDHRGNVVEVNRATERTFGYRAEELIGRELAADRVDLSIDGGRHSVVVGPRERRSGTWNHTWGWRDI